jgi:type I restriction enzyme S subunit
MGARGGSQGMKLETFFEKFDQFADAPDAVAKMRGLILRLAMQGDLSESHKTDGPVSELLREVDKDQMRLGLESSSRATSGNSDFSDDETADVTPARWAWVRFGNIARHNAGKTLDKGRNRGELRDYITTSNLYWGFFQLDAVRQMPMLDDELERCTAIKGDLLICEGGEAGRAAVWPHAREISFQNHVHRARFFAGINPYFVQRYLEKLNATGEIEKYRKGVGISNMSGKALASIPIPLPPLAEQKRIVAKVDELMALCDRLALQQQERGTRHAALARASLARFADEPTPANLTFLFHPSYAISPADLRKSILTLAVQGKLVP